MVINTTPWMKSYSSIKTKSKYGFQELQIIYQRTSDWKLALEETGHLEKFIKKYLEKGNTVITDGWLGYSFLDNGNSGYQHIKHLYSGGDFWSGFESTSHIE